MSIRARIEVDGYSTCWHWLLKKFNWCFGQRRIYLISVFFPLRMSCGNWFTQRVTFFWAFLWSWVSRLRFAKWTGSIRGHRGVRRRVLLKGDGRKTTRRHGLHVYPFSLSAPRACRRGDGDTCRPCMEARRVGLQSPNQNKQADGERAERARRPRWVTQGPSFHDGPVISNQKPGIPNGQTANDYQKSLIFLDFPDKHEDSISSFPGTKPCQGNWLIHICWHA